ncbi:hypothetical protein [Limibacillus sp. MBR-115]|uniref:hypothetical protein n=1 Tax=Limibacillus sp. MBR-115 TaxID=3156465 RepID=UPI003392DA9E
MWIDRRYSGSGKYETKHLGIADDFENANRKSVLDFTQALEAALNRAWERYGIELGIAGDMVLPGLAIRKTTALIRGHGLRCIWKRHADSMVMKLRLSSRVCGPA